MENLVGAGDSITHGQTPGSISYLTVINPTGVWTFKNEGIDGNTVASMIGQGPTLDGDLVGGETNVLVVWAGTNDMGNVGNTPSTTFSNLVTYCRARQAAGWIVLVVPMMSRTGTNPVGGETMDADKSAYNASISANWRTFSSGLVALPPVLTADGGFANTANFLDGIHPTQAAVTNLIAPAIQLSVNKLGGPTMGLAVVNTASGGGAGSTLAPISGVFSSTTGNMLVAHVRSGSDITSVKNAAGVSFTPGLPQFANGTNFQFFYLPNITGNASDSVVANLAGATTFTSIYVWEISGADPSSPYDIEAFASGLSATTAITGAYSTSQADEIILGVADANAINETFAAQAGYSLDSNGFPLGAGNLYSGSEHLIVSSIQTNITTSMTYNSAATWQMHAIAFKAAPFSISGNAGVGHANVTFSGTSSGQVTADSSGNYTIPGLLDGGYTITPSLAGFTFSPTNQNVTLSGSSVTGIDFTATPIPSTGGTGFGGDRLRKPFGFSFGF